jgi:hypothetical protein
LSIAAIDFENPGFEQKSTESAILALDGTATMKRIDALIKIGEKKY